MARLRPALWGLCLCLGLALGPALGAQRARPLKAHSAHAPAALDQILGDGQPEDIGYGFQRARAIPRSVRSSRKDTSPKTPPQFMLSAAAGDDPAVTKSMFRERMVRQRRQRQQQQQPQTQQWSDWRHETPDISSFYPPVGPNDPVENPERYLQALREAWVRYQQQTGAIDVGPDDLTDLETLQFLEALGAGEDIPGAHKRSSAPSVASGPGQYAVYANNAPADWSSDWSSPLAWSGYPLQKRSASYEFQDDSGEWADGAGDDGEGDVGLEGGPVVPGSRLAALLSQQLFDERYDDPAVKRLLLAKRSTSTGTGGGSQQHKAQDVADGLQGRAMRRRKKSTRPALAAAMSQQQTMSQDRSQSQHDANMHKDLARLFGEPEPDGEPEPPLALPLVAGEVEPPLALPLSAGHGLVKRTAVAATAGTTAPAAAPIASAAGGAVTTTSKSAPASTTTTAPARKATPAPAGKNDVPTGIVAHNPIGHAHETDKIAHEHHEQHLQHGAHTPTIPPIASEHAPPMVSAEGPHGHDHAVHAENKEAKPGSPPGAGAGAGAAEAVTKMSLLEAEEPMYMDAASHPRRLAKKSIDWSQYFGLDRRRKKSLSFNDVDAQARIDPDWMMRHNLVGFRLLLPPSSKPSKINKRVAVKKEGASPDSLLFGSWGRQGQGHGAWGWADSEDGAEDDDGMDDDGEAGGDELGRCPAVQRLAESCRLAVGSNDGLLVICMMYQACHICGSAVGVPVGSSCETELARRGAEMCADSSPGVQRLECHGRVGAIMDLYRARQPVPDTETCARQPCLEHFFLLL